MTTVNLELPELAASQSQPHLTINAALRRIDALAQASCISILNTPPGSPTEGDRYVVGAAPTGAWLGKAGNIASYIGTTWVFSLPKTGWLTYIQSLNALHLYQSGTWNMLSVTGAATDAIFDAKGDLVVGTAANTATRLPHPGVNDWLLLSDSSQPSGLRWAPPLGDGAFYSCVNIGAGAEIFAGTDTGGDPELHSFRTIVAGPGITITQNADTIEIQVTGAGSGGQPSKGAKARKITTAQTLTTGIDTEVSFNQEDFDDDGMYSTGDGNRLYATASGWHTIYANILFTANGVGYRRTTLRFHDASAGFATTDIAQVAYPANATVTNAQNVVAQYYMDAGDYITVRCTQTSGGDLTIVADPLTCMALIRHS